MVQSLDSVTGLPVIGPADIIEQIPLGQQVFPFADLSATQRPVRQPYYGDDVIPTSSLVVGQDKTGAPRAGRMDTARNLYVREAVFQSNGAPIKDGTTAPVDVIVTNGGGTSSAILDSFDNEGGSNIETTGDFLIIPEVSFTKPILLLDVFVIPSFKDFASPQYGFCNIQFADNTRLRRFDLPSVPFMQAGAAPESVAMGHISIIIPGGFSIASFFAGASSVDLLANLPGGAYAIWAQVSATLWYGA